MTKIIIPQSPKDFISSEGKAACRVIVNDYLQDEKLAPARKLIAQLLLAVENLEMDLSEASEFIAGAMNAAEAIIPGIQNVQAYDAETHGQHFIHAIVSHVKEETITEM